MGVTSPECHHRYNTSEKGRARHAQYNTSEKGRARQAQYNTSEKGRARQAQYNKTQKRMRSRRLWRLRKSLELNQEALRALE